MSWLLFPAIFVASIIMVCICMYIGDKCQKHLLNSVLDNLHRLPITVMHKEKEVTISYKETRIEFPDWEDGGHINSATIYFNNIPALCIVRPFLGDPCAYERNEYDNSPVYPILKKIKKQYNKNISKNWNKSHDTLKKFF